MKKKMIERFINEMQDYNHFILADMVTNMINSQWDYCLGMKSLLEEIGMEVLITKDVSSFVTNIYIDGVHYAYYALSENFKLHNV